MDFRLCHSREDCYPSSSHQSPDLIFMFSEGSIIPLQLIPYCALFAVPIKQGVPGGSCDQSHAKTVELLRNSALETTANNTVSHNAFFKV